LRFLLAASDRHLTEFWRFLLTDGLGVDNRTRRRLWNARGRRPGRRSGFPASGSGAGWLRSCPHQVSHVQRGSFGSRFCLPAFCPQPLLYLEAASPVPPEHGHGKDEQENRCGAAK
jgi:hypothetical protein